MNRTSRAAAITALLLTCACKKQAPPPLYEPVAVARRDIVVAAEAAGSIEPILVVDVKSRASGQILQMRVETGDVVHQGDTLVMVDRRDPTNTFNQAQADLEVARAQLATAQANKQRSDQMYQSQLISEQEKEQADLQYANARAQLVRAEVNVQNARDQLNDCNVLAPLDGVIIQKNVEAGQVIVSATRDVSGGTVLLRMADLAVVQVRTLVDETDIGKIQPGLRANITVDAYPNRPFEGTVLKIEPQSTTSQNVTMFPVLIRIPNDQGLLRPGMNAEVEIQVAQRGGVLAIPNAALRTTRDVGSAAQVLGLDPADVQRTLAQQDSLAGANRTQLVQGASRGGQAGGQQAARSAPAETATSLGGTTAPAGEQAVPEGGQTARRPDGQLAGGTAGGSAPGGQTGDMAQGGPRMRPPLPEGVTEEQWGEIRRKRQAGEPLTAAESTIAARVRENFQRMGGFGGQGGGFGRQGGFSGQQGQAQAGTTGAAAGATAGTSARPSWLPSGVSEEQARDIMRRGFSGGTLSGQEQAIFTRIRSAFAAGGMPRRRFGAGNSFQFGGSYIVFVLRHGKPEPVRIRTGVTDMDYSEVLSGLTEQDTVLLLPSASLVQSQQDMRERFQRMTGGGAVPGMRQQSAPTTGGAARQGTGR